MAVGVIVSSSRVDDQATGLDRCCELQSMRRVMDALFKRSAITTSEAACPQQIGHTQTACCQKLDSLLLILVGQLLPPHANRRVTRALVVFDVLLQRPTKGRDFVHRKLRHVVLPSHLEANCESILTL